jgi:hypothetical protein
MLDDEGDQIVINDGLNLLLVAGRDVGQKPNRFLEFKKKVLIINKNVGIIRLKLKAKKCPAK